MVIDTSALVAIIMGEPERDAFLSHMADASIARISTASVVEAGVVLLRKRRENAEGDLVAFLANFDVVIEPLTPEQAVTAREAYRRFGKGRHPAKLNFGDTFSYALAMHLGEPLLYKGCDFAQTDVRSALAG